MKADKSLVLGIVALAILTASGIALSGPAYEVETVYYSDASKTTIIGESDILCSGKSTSWGETSQYTRVDSSPCRGAGPCNIVTGCLDAQQAGALKENNF